MGEPCSWLSSKLSPGRNALRTLTLTILLIGYVFVGPYTWLFLTGHPMDLFVFILWLALGYYKGFEIYLKLLRAIPGVSPGIRWAMGYHIDIPQ